MLSLYVMTAISAVALPYLRITTLSIVRTLSLSAPVLTYLCILLINSNTVLLFDGIISVDMLSLTMIVLSLITAIIALVYYNVSIVRLSGTSFSLSLLVSLMLLGAIFLCIATDLVTAALSLELQSFAIYAITTVYRWREGATRAGLMYFMLGAFSSGLVLLGLSLIYVYMGVTTFDSISNLIELDIGNTSAVSISMSILMCGLLFKVTAAPFHFWSPAVYDNAPTVVTVFIALIPKLALFSFIVRMVGLINTSTIVSLLYMSVGLSLVFGSIIGLVQSRIKRVLAYSTVSHVGWMTLCVIVGGLIGIGSLAFYVAQYSFTTGLSFLTLIALGYTQLSSYNIGNTNAYDVETLTSIAGMYTRSVTLCAIMAVSLFSAAGIPPIVGFYAKLAVLQGALFHNQYLIASIGILTSVISAGFYLSVVSTMIFSSRTQSLLII